MLRVARVAVALSAVCLPALLVAQSALVQGCSRTDSSASVSAGDDGGDAGADVLAPPPIQRTQNEGQLAPRRQACAFQAGAWPAQTIGTDYPVGADIPIDHVIVVMQENRSFDNYLG